MAGRLVNMNKRGNIEKSGIRTHQLSDGQILFRERVDDLSEAPDWCAGSAQPGNERHAGGALHVAKRKVRSGSPLGRIPASLPEYGGQIWWVMMPRCRSEAILTLSGCSVIKTFCICSPLGCRSITLTLRNSAARDRVFR